MKVLNQIPFGDLEAMIDPSTPDITGRVLEMLGCINHSIATKEVDGGFQISRKNSGKGWALVGKVGGQLRLRYVVRASGAAFRGRGHDKTIHTTSRRRA